MKADERARAIHQREDEIRRLLDQGAEEQARALLRGWRTETIRDPGLHERLGLLAEALGETRRAISEYNLCLRADRSRSEVILRLARIRAERGELERALRAYRRYLLDRPEDSTVAREAAEFLRLCGRPDLVGALPEAARATLNGPREDFQEAAESIRPTDADCVTFAELFSGREGVHARQWVGPSGRSGYSPVREPFTPAVARQHLLGAYTVGIYPLRMDNTVFFLAVDFDMAKGQTPARGVGALMRRVHQTALKLVEEAARWGLPTLLEDSGHKGRHVWVLFAQPIPAAAARRMGNALLTRIGRPPEGVGIELFPKQSRVAGQGLGNLIKLPLGVHRLTNRRALLLDPATGEPFPEQLRALGRYERVSRQAAIRALQELERATAGMSRVIPFPGGRLADAQGGGGAAARAPAPAVVSLESEATPFDREDDLGYATIPAPVEEAPYDPESDLEFLALVTHCAVLGELVRRVENGGVLSTDERIVITHSLGHLEHGPEAVNHLLSRTLNADPESFLKSRLRGNPISCPRIRSRLPQIAAAVQCDCRFAPDSGMYPTPLLHLESAREVARGGTAGTRLTRLQLERLVLDLIRARTRAERARRLARELEQRLAAVLEEQGLSHLDTATGRVRLEGGVVTITLGAGDGGAECGGGEPGRSGGKRGGGEPGVAPSGDEDRRSPERP
jgi:tetratricopeptide (TPR) repeat protein